MLHNIQKELLKRLVLKNSQRFGELTFGYDFGDNVAFHLKQLIKNGFAQKRSLKYYITKDGLEYSANYDLKTLADKKFKSIYIAFICKLGNKYMLRERKSESSVFYKLPGAKPLYGISFSEEIQRIFKLETNLKIDFEEFTFDGMHFKIQKTSNGRTLFDDVLMVYYLNLDNMNVLRGIKLRENTKWFEKEEIQYLKGKWPEIDICIFRNEWKPILEYTFVNDYNIEKEDL